MDAFLTELVRLVPPPAQPTQAGSDAALAAVERELGLTFPTAYKWVIRHYGQGLWQGFWCILTPFAEERGQPRPWFCPRSGLVGGPAWCDTLRWSSREWPSLYPHPVYPEAGGLFPWAFTDNGDTLYWLTQGEPDSWRTLFESDDPDGFSLSFSELLLKIVTDGWLFRDVLGPRFVYGQPSAFAPWPWHPRPQGAGGPAEPGAAADGGSM
ncbi:MAG: hypothetical protein JNM56_18380 [Planctomycetia bacterium]|nr:hypothetical protein [Planctomycetia bacterium]